MEELADEAAEEREERLAEERSEDRDERRALYDVLQASWSDTYVRTVYFLERERLEAWEAVEVGEADAPFVDYDDRHDGLE